jgi:maleate cis-trans isomerase
LTQTPQLKNTPPQSAASCSFPARSDGGPTRHGAVGLVALATDHVCELDLRQIVLQDRLPLYVGRIAFAPEITVETLSAMRDGITGAAALILAGR